MIGRFFTTLFTVRRQQWSGNSSREVVQGIFKGQIQQASAELAAQINAVYGKVFTIWCPLTSDVTEGDTLVDGSTTYSVRALLVNQNGENAHLELTVIKDD